jgi:putative acetyltransferase
MTTIRRERADDVPAIHAVHCAAFPTDLEARLVDRLRENGHATISLVAEIQEQIVGHILFSPVTIADQRANALGLAPVAVQPAYQRRGIGGRLILAGLDVCREHDIGLVVLLGHPDYYPRFGFQRASRFGLDNEYGADEAFMVLELCAQSIPASGGLVRYGPEFAEFA